MPSESEDSGSRHQLYEDLLALLFGTLLVSIGLAFYAEARLVTGSAAGLALLLDYATGYGFGPIFFVINLPFYLLAIRRMGWAFTLRTFVAVLLLSVLSRVTPQWLDIGAVAPAYAAVAGGTLIGTGLLVLFRHRAGLGGFNILALHLQENFAIRAGYFQLGVDLAILAAAATMLDLEHLALSVLGAVVMNLIIAINHKPGRYVGVS